MMADSADSSIVVNGRWTAENHDLFQAGQVAALVHDVTYDDNPGKMTSSRKYVNRPKPSPVEISDAVFSLKMLVDSDSYRRRKMVEPFMTGSD